MSTYCETNYVKNLSAITLVVYRTRFREERPAFQCWRLFLAGHNVSVLGFARPINRRGGRPALLTDRLLCSVRQERGARSVVTDDRRL